MLLLGAHGRAVLCITPCQAQEDVTLLLESTVLEVEEMEKQLRRDDLDPEEMYKKLLNNDISQKVAQAFSVLYQIECYSQHLRISKEMLDRAASVQQAMRMLGHTAWSPAPCPPLEPLSYWTVLNKTFSLLHHLKTAMQELQLGCTD
ncbi:uncharacterized protein LOC143527303 [Brachyhypopomus gauderio]|uniref:uncharacterized protein LOC143527303 n=1 Tax=Brachyhypopomus gauderio TaxID=698409 RepID=UPI0040428B69